MIKLLFTTSLFIVLVSFGVAQELTISRKELKEKIAGYWMGQIVGNYMGFPFENLYDEETGPIPVDITQYLSCRADHELLQGDLRNLRINCKDRRGYTDIFALAMGGAPSDDDTDIEFVYLHAIEKYGLDITYPEMTEMWKKHINRFIWGGNAAARRLMDEGLLPPETGKKENNHRWYYIDAQIENEIWGAIYPGMTRQAAEKTDWSARITNDDWTVQLAVAYSVMYSAAYFEDDLEKLVGLALNAIPQEGPFYEGLTDVIKWHQENTDWEITWQLIVNKYRIRYLNDKSLGVPAEGIAGLHNCLLTIMAILYGEGDFISTVNLAVRAGFDNDCNAATAAGLIATAKGLSCIPDYLLYEMGREKKWKEPFNNQYVNFTRDELPIVTKMSDIIERILVVTEKAIWENGGHKIEKDGEILYVINTDIF
jgi:ADP-ribosylglycohydrolase